MKSIIVTLLLISVFATNCKGKNETTTSITAQSISSFESLDPKSFVDKIQSSDNVQIIDVRTASEFAEQHLENATNVDFNNASFDTEIAKRDKSKPTFVYCLSGGRSASAVSKMKDLGFTEIYEMEGGIMKYNAVGLVTKIAETTGMSMDDYQKLFETEKTVVIDFYAEWCGPCKQMAPYLDKMKIDLKDKVTIIRIDVDKNESLATEMKVDALPTIMVYKSKKMTWKNVGYIAEEELKKHL
jgi:thioredoxin